MRYYLTFILCAFCVSASAQQPVSNRIALPITLPEAAPVVDCATALKNADELVKGNKLVEAREQLLGVLDKAPADLRPQVEDKTGRINIELIMTPRAMPEKINHTIRQGDTLARLARANGTTEILLQKSNEITDPSLIKFGYRLRIFNGTFKVTVNKSRNDLVLDMNGRFFKRYRVGTGKFGKTPTGAFQVQDRMAEPVWYRSDGKMVPYGDKENILGTHWLSLRTANTNDDIKGYGIHGTWDETTIGQSVSAGCVRLKNSDAEELYTLLPSGTLVVIEE